MGRPRKTETQRRAEKFSECYRVGKARLGFGEDTVAQIVGLSRQAFRLKRAEPEKMKLGEFIQLSKAFGWSDEEILSIIRSE